MTKRKKVLGIIITFAMFISFIPILEVQAKDNTHANIFPYVMFADKITIDSRSNVINGNVHTLKPVKGLNISGNISKDKNEKQIDKQLSIISDFFINNNYKQTENIYSDNSINISSSFDYSVGSIKNIDICAEVINTNNSVLYSKDGDINFNCKNVNFSGLIYAPQGNVNISADNINIDGIIISKSISIKGLNVNINNNTFFENYLGNSSDSYYEESDIYTYKYDVFGKTKSISIDNQLLVEYVYSNSFNSKLLYEKFGNGTFKNYSNSSDSKSTQLEKYISESLVDRKHNSSENYTELTNTYNNNKSISTYYCDNDLNIIKDTNDQKDRTYVYDEKNQLVRANDQKANKSYTYSYDSRGNIINTTEYDYSLSELLNPIHTTDYKYNNQWLDRLDSYEGNMITYDQIGNPTYYKGWSFSWEKADNSNLHQMVIIVLFTHMIIMV